MVLDSAMKKQEASIKSSKFSGKKRESSRSQKHIYLQVIFLLEHKINKKNQQRID